MHGLQFEMKTFIFWIIICESFLSVVSTSSKYANISGDIMLGALFPVHAASGDEKCGKIQEQDGIQMLEATAFTINTLNTKGMLPGFTLGMIAMDTCESDSIALENTLEFVKSKVNAEPIQDQHVYYTCSDGSTPLALNNSSNLRQKIRPTVGVIGPAFSKLSVQVASFLRLFKVPQISYYSTSPELSDKERFSYFKRTVPSDQFQARVVAEILRKFKWEYVSCLYEDSSYGVNLYSEVEKLSDAFGICFGYVEKIPFSHEEDQEMDSTISKLLEKQNKNGKVVVILFLRYTLANKVFRSVKRLNAENRLMWVGSDGWSGRQFHDDDIRNIVHGSITVQPLARKLTGFDDYFTGLNLEKDTWNPWFSEYWESHFNCKLSDEKRTFKEEKNSCDQYKSISAENGYKQLLALYFVSDAVVAFATALKQIHHDTCEEVRGLCNNMSKFITSGEKVLAYLDKVNFIDSLGNNFTFINGTDGPPRYSIMTYYKSGRDYDWKEIGNFSGIGDRYELHIDATQTVEPYERSSCSSQCNAGQYRSIDADDKCCWNCRNCRVDQYLVSLYLCEDCPKGHLPNNFRNACYAVPVEELTFTNPWSIAACTFSSLGIVCCIFVSIVYFIKRDTPVIKASGMELSLVLLVGILLSYVSTFVYVAPPTAFSCGATRFHLGTCYTLCYAAVATKTNRIYRIFDGSSPKKKKFTGWQSSLVITFLITIVEVLAVATWLISDVPRTVTFHPTVSESILLCNDVTDYSYLGVLVYPFVVMIVCLYFAIKTRKTPDGFNETSQIAFCSYSTFILWLAFIPVYFVTKDNTIRIMALCFSMSVNASVCLVSLFFTKVYIVVFSPEKNTKETVMTRSTQRSSTATEFNGGSRTASSFTLNLNGNTPRMSFQPPFGTISTISTLSMSDIDSGLRQFRNQRQISQESGCFKPELSSENLSLSRSLPNLLDADYKSLTRQRKAGNQLQSVTETTYEQNVDSNAI